MSNGPNQSALIFGASGNIGHTLYQKLSAKQWKVAGTYTNHPKPNLFPYDITAPVKPAIDFSQYGYGIVLSAACNIDQCCRNPEGTRAINVTGTIRLVSTLVDQGVKPVFFSTDYVYDGKKGAYTETDPPCPNTEYGRQKAEIEQHLLCNCPTALIVRLSKVFSTNPKDNTLLAQWYRMIQEEKTIKNASDQRTCPTVEWDVIEGLTALLKKGSTGLYNLCQPVSYTRAELLAEFLQALNIHYPNTLEWETRRFGFLDERPENTSLDPQKFVAHTGFKFTPMNTAFKKFSEAIDKRET